MRHLLSTALGLALLGGLSACNSSETVSPPETPDITAFDQASSEMSILDYVNTQLEAGEPVEFTNPLDTHAVTFIKLSLAMGVHDGNFVDAYSCLLYTSDAADD